MAHHSHVRFTPAPKDKFGKDLPVVEGYDFELIKKEYPKVIVAEEVSEGGIPHYHLWIETDVCEKTVREYVVAALRIPKVGRGQTNAYYCLKYDAYTDPSPAYVCADGKLLYYKGYTEEEVQKYIEEGRKKYGGSSTKCTIRQEVKVITKKSIEDIFDEYVEAVLPKDKTVIFTLDSLKRKSIGYWRSRSRLLPTPGYRSRFIASAWLEWCDITRRGEGLGISDLEEKNLL